MSIIYEALKKTQKKREDIQCAGSQISTNEWQKWINLRFIILPVLLLVGLFLSYYAYQYPGSEETLVLNGVFLSGEDKYAMINNQPYKVGDKVADKSVVSIDMNDVRLMGSDRRLTTLTVAM